MTRNRLKVSRRKSAKQSSISERGSLESVAVAERDPLTKPLPASRWRRWALIPALLLIAATIYYPAVTGEFIWDDSMIYIVKNPLLRMSDGIYRFWLTTEAADYYPLTYTTFWVEWQLAGENTTLYHVNNILLHALCGAVLYLLLRQLQVPAAWLVCLLFVVHPLQVESVAWISQRKTILGALFGFAAAAEYVGFLRSGNRWSYARGVVWFAISLSAKPTLITLPALLAIYDLWQAPQIPQRWRLVAARTAPYFLLSLLFGVVGVLFQQKLMGGIDVRNQDLASRLASLGWAAWFYILQSVRVWDLSFVYPRWEVDGWSPLAWIPNLAMVGLGGLAWRMRRRWGLLPVCAWLAYLVTMLPSLGIVDVFFWRYSFVGDHYVYQSLPAILAVWVWAGVRITGSDRRRVMVGATAGILLAVCLSVVTYQRAAVYQTEKGIWRDTIDKNPRAALAWSQLGVMELRCGQLDVAAENLQRAIECDPQLAEVWCNLGELHRYELNWPAALADYENAVGFAAPGSVNHVAHAGRCVALLQTGRERDAIDASEIALRDLEKGPQSDDYLTSTMARTLVYRKAASERLRDGTTAAIAERSLQELLQSRPKAHQDVATAYEELGDMEAAQRHWHECVRNYPDDFDIVFAAALSACKFGRFEIAFPLLTKSAQLQPNNPWSYAHLGLAQLNSGSPDEAIQSFQKAVAIEPGNSQLHSNIALTYAVTGQHQKAAETFRHVIRLNPSDYNAMRDLAWVLSTSPLASERGNVREALELAERACELSEYTHPESLDALAAAMAAAGDFAAARDTIDRALTLPDAASMTPEKLDSMKERRALYASNRAFRER